MILIIGGRWQGRLDYVRSRFGLTDDDICLGGVDFNKKCLAYIDTYALECVKQGKEPADIFRANEDSLKDKIVVATDISCGVVPMDPVMRAWREANGRMNNWLAGRADEVWRLFCGIPQRIK